MKCADASGRTLHDSQAALQAQLSKPSYAHALGSAGVAADAAQPTISVAVPGFANRLGALISVVDTESTGAAAAMRDAICCARLAAVGKSKMAVAGSSKSKAD